MTEPTRDETLSAHDALDALCGRIPEDTHTDALRRRILRALPSKPALTMAEIAWDDDKHFLAEATHLVYETVLMLGQDSDDAIKFLALNRADRKTVWGQPRDLTPTGKRYTLTEVQE